jgi:hypothetical protein
MTQRFQVGDSVEVSYFDGRVRIGMIQSIEFDVVKVLIGGAEGHVSVMICPTKLCRGGPHQWRMEMDPPAGRQGRRQGKQA